jgi:hypothetical protein
MLPAQLSSVLHCPLWMPSSYPPFKVREGRGTRCCGGFCSLKATRPLDGETGGAATEAHILQRNESRDIRMPRGALNTEGPKNQNPPIRANGAR